MKAQLTVTMDNAAFADGNDKAELARILRDLADNLEAGDGTDGATLHDLNGNKVGRFDITD